MAAAVVGYDTAGKTTPRGYEEAIKRLSARVANDPDNRWNLLLASMYRGNGNFPRTAELVDSMLADPKNQVDKVKYAKDPKKDPGRRRRIPILWAAADIFQNGPKPDLEKSRAAYVELLQLEPENLAVLNNLAYLLSEAMTPSRPQQAKVYSGKAYDISKSSGSPNDLIFDTHGWILTLCGGDDARRG